MSFCIPKFHFSVKPTTYGYNELSGKSVRYIRDIVITVKFDVINERFGTIFVRVITEFD
jgi:hypothetical protein